MPSKVKALSNNYLRLLEQSKTKFNKNDFNQKTFLLVTYIENTSYFDGFRRLVIPLLTKIDNLLKNDKYIP